MYGYGKNVLCNQYRTTTTTKTIYVNIKAFLQIEDITYVTLLIV